jgi:hypothetical protein
VKAIGILSLVVGLTVVVFLLSMLPASAQPVPGAVYSGTVTGCTAPPCGSVSFSVSGDGSKVQAFMANNVPGDYCEFLNWTFPGTLDIVDDSFGPGIPGMFEVSGWFSSWGSAQGTLRLVVHGPSCDTGPLSWTATTPTTPTPSPSPTATVPPGVGGAAELPDVSGSSAPTQLALAALAAATLVALTAGGWYARRR